MIYVFGKTKIIYRIRMVYKLVLQFNTCNVLNNEQKIKKIKEKISYLVTPKKRELS